MKTKRLLSLVLAVVLVITVMPTTALAAGNPSDSSKDVEIWDGFIATGFDGGSGTPEDPYRIANGGQLAYLAQQIVAAENANDYKDKCFVLTEDIYLNDTKYWEDWGSTDEDTGEVTAPVNSWIGIGGTVNNRSKYFRGDFDGKNHTVYGVYINDNKNMVGLFGCCEASTISNLGVEKSYIKGSSYVGGIAGSHRASITESSPGYLVFDGSIISGCHFSGTVIATRDHAGGVAGYCQGFMEDCYNTGSVSGDKYVGGVAGTFSITEDITKDTQNFYNTGTVIGRGNEVGGVFGVFGGSGYKVKNCHNSGSVSGDGHVGGIAGKCYGEFIDCYNIGDIKGTEVYKNFRGTGGIVGFLLKNSSSAASKVINCTNYGNVVGAAEVGGIVGSTGEGNTITNCINNGNVESNVSIEWKYGDFGALGGVMGRANVCTVENCINNGVIRESGSNHESGGVVGYCSDSDITNCTNNGSMIGAVGFGGVVGNAKSSTIKDCRNISSAKNVLYGGIVAGIDKVTVENCYNTSTILVDFGGGGIVGHGEGDIIGCYNSGDIIWDGQSRYLINLGGIAAMLSGSITDCCNTGGIGNLDNLSSVNESWAVSYVGGMIGKCDGALTMTDCRNYGEIKGGYYIGGLIGYGSSEEGTDIKNSFNKGTITGTSRCIGGLVGYSSSHTFNMDSCFNTGDVLGGSDARNVGGIVGGVTYIGGLEQNANGIYNCYNTGNITGRDGTVPVLRISPGGGIIGASDDGIGGIVGEGRIFNEGRLKNCYNVGTINAVKRDENGTTDVGGTIGMRDKYSSAEPLNCYYLDTCFSDSNEYGTALTDEKLRQQESYEGYDFDNIWTMAGDPDYPYAEFAVFAENATETHSCALNLKLDDEAYSGQTLALGTDDEVLYSLTEDGSTGVYNASAVPNDEYTVWLNGEKISEPVLVDGKDVSKDISYYTVTFHANGGTPEPAKQVVLSGQRTEEPAAMTKDNQVFDGWYQVSSQMGSKWDFTTYGVSKATDLYAKWLPDPIYSISLSRNRVCRFDAKEPGYLDADLKELIVKVTNTGNRNTGSLQVALSGSNADAFTVSSNDLLGIAIGGNTLFTIKPKEGLDSGTYTATVSVGVAGDNTTPLTTQTFDVSFTVGVTESQLLGTVVIDGTPKYRETLTASLSGGNNTGKLHYQWKQGDENGTDIGTDSSTYTPTVEDINKTITCIITSSVETGSVSGTSTVVNPIRLSEISVTVTKPVTDEEINLTVTPNNSGYTISRFAWECNGDVMASGSKFDAGKTYTATVVCRLVDGYVLENIITMKINESKARYLFLDPGFKFQADFTTPAHVHSWLTTWSNDSTGHWHECDGAGTCGITENTSKDSYGKHVYDSDADTTCNTCGYVRTVTPPTATPTAKPTATPTTAPPTPTPTTAPPTPTPKATSQPTATPGATATSIKVPTATPTAAPTSAPTAKPTPIPTAKPTSVPTQEPTASPAPLALSTPVPTTVPLAIPTTVPTVTPLIISDREENDTNKEPGVASIASLKNKAVRKLIVKLKKKGEGVAFQLAYKKSKTAKFKYIVIKKSTVTLKNVSKKKTYFLKVRTYIKDGKKKSYGKWSNTKKIKVKK